VPYRNHELEVATLKDGMVLSAGHCGRVPPRRAGVYNWYMVRQLEAVFEKGVLRPLEPLSLAEKQHVLVTITDVPRNEATFARREEQEWLSAHGHEYRGQWVALQGNVLLSHGPKGRVVRDEARQMGFPRPLLVRVPEDLELPSAGN